MASFAEEFLRIDRQHLDLRAGALGLAVLSAFAAAIAIWGPVALAAAIGALVCWRQILPRPAVPGPRHCCLLWSGVPSSRSSR